jgi:mannose-6-phosphate isomerase
VSGLGHNLAMEVEHRPWGSFEVLSEAPTHKVKRLTVKPGKRLSYQRHRHRSEHWFVVGGLGVATVDGSARRVGPGDTVDVLAGAAHRIESAGPEPLVLIEVQHGTSFEEDDIERLEDDYGRVP